MEKSICCGASYAWRYHSCDKCKGITGGCPANIGVWKSCSLCDKPFEPQVEKEEKSWKDSPETDIRVEDPQNLSKGDKERTHIRTSLTYCLPAGINDDEWEVIINNVEGLISQAQSKHNQDCTREEWARHSERSRIMEKIKELLQTPAYNKHQTYDIAIKEVLSIITNQ